MEMTTREIYFKCKFLCDMPVGIIFYVIKDNNDIIQLGQQLWVQFKEDDMNIEKMVEIEKIEGFMFWNKSVEGELWFKNNHKEISNCLIKSFNL